MLLHMLCVRDRAADVFGTPTFHLSIGAAVRGFTDEINREDKSSVMFNHPEDFDLYVLGTYDDSGLFEVVEKPRQVCVGKDVALRNK